MKRLRLRSRGPGRLDRRRSGDPDPSGHAADAEAARVNRLGTPRPLRPGPAGEFIERRRIGWNRRGRADFRMSRRPPDVGSGAARPLPVSAGRAPRPSRRRLGPAVRPVAWGPRPVIAPRGGRNGEPRAAARRRVEGFRKAAPSPWSNAHFSGRKPASQPPCPLWISRPAGAPPDVFRKAGVDTPRARAYIAVTPDDGAANNGLGGLDICLKRAAESSDRPEPVVTDLSGWMGMPVWLCASGFGWVLAV